MDKEWLEVEEHRAMIYVPEDAVELTINAKIYRKGEICDVMKTMNMAEIREAFKKADEGYIDEDDIFCLTEKGREYLDSRTLQIEKE